MAYFGSTDLDALWSEPVGGMPPQTQDHDHEERPAEPTSDLFCCLLCRALWLVTIPSGDDGPTVVPTSERVCDNCRDQRSDPADVLDFSQPVGDPPQPADVHIPELGREARTDLGVRFVAEVVESRDAVANGVARYASGLARRAVDTIAPPADSDCTFKAIADGLDRIPKEIRKGVALVAREVIGMPEFFAEVLGELASRIAEPYPLKTLAKCVRITGTVIAAADGELLRSAVARDLAEAEFEDALRNALSAPPDPTEPPEPPAPTRPPPDPGGL